MMAFFVLTKGAKLEKQERRGPLSAFLAPFDYLLVFFGGIWPPSETKGDEGGQRKIWGPLRPSSEPETSPPTWGPGERARERRALRGQAVSLGKPTNAFSLGGPRCEEEAGKVRRPPPESGLLSVKGDRLHVEGTAGQRDTTSARTHGEVRQSFGKREQP